VGVLLSLRGVSKSYWRGDREVRVLSAVSLDVHAGEFAAVWGTRGSGKSTLLKLAARLEVPDSGSVHFDERDLASLSEREHAQLMQRQIGWVRRTGPRSDLRMRDYVALPLLAEYGRRHASIRADEAIERVGLAAQASQRWASLSDGDRALFGIAHGIARAPRLLLVDDPVANLDVLERERVTDLLHSLVDEQAIGVLMAVPEMPATMHADRIFALGRGRLASVAPPQPPGTLERGQVIDLRSARYSL
jgi:ABC-type lipoprotein export system ATPase subunit